MQIRHLLQRIGGGHRGRRVPMFLALSVLTVAAPASGQRWIPADGSFRGHRLSGTLVEVQVLVDGRRTPFYTAPGQWDRSYFEASHGQNYALRIRNRTDRRVGVLIAVDGLNVVNGERS